MTGKRTPTRREPTTAPVGVDLFCGAGGMSLGFEMAGFDVICGIDVDPIHLEAYKNNFPQGVAWQTDIRTLERAELKAQTGAGSIDVLFGGPPCQGFSYGGRHDPEDPRNELLTHFGRLVSELRPRYFVVENVPGILRNNGTLIESFLNSVSACGYDVVEPIRDLDAADFGVPQRRRRVFILGAAGGEHPLTYPKVNGREAPSAWQAIGDLPELDRYEYLLRDDVFRGSLGEPSDYAAHLRTDRIGIALDPAEPVVLSGCSRSIHRKATVARFSAIRPGTRDPISRFYRLAKDDLAPTLRAGSGPEKGSYTAPRPIHPEADRCITVREAARLHSIPDWFALHHTKWHGFRQVGNAVPPLLAKAVAERVGAAILGHAS
jgi:DNA (cytosine-5)-methyltransferase 1